MQKYLYFEKLAGFSRIISSFFFKNTCANYGAKYTASVIFFHSYLENIAWDYRIMTFYLKSRWNLHKLNNSFKPLNKKIKFGPHVREPCPGGWSKRLTGSLARNIKDYAHRGWHCVCLTSQRAILIIIVIAVSPFTWAGLPGRSASARSYV